MGDIFTVELPLGTKVKLLRDQIWSDEPINVPHGTLGTVIEPLEPLGNDEDEIQLVYIQWHLQKTSITSYVCIKEIDIIELY